jgi:hypothetical protein
MNTPTIYIFHSKLQIVTDNPRDIKARKTYVPKQARVTVVGKYDKGELHLAVARCSDKDNFSKKIGRRIATGRLESGKLYTSVATNKQDVDTFVRLASMAAEEVLLSKEIIL